MPDLFQMQVLVLTSELGSLAAVARKLGITPAAISKQLSKLEKELDVQLLVRTTRHIEFTEIGINYCSQCRQILEEVEIASAFIAQAKATPNGVLKVVSGRHFANTFLIPHMKEFLLKYPQIELNLELAERIPDLSLESIDVVIGMSVQVAGDAIQRRIATTSYSFCASPCYLLQFGTPKTPKDLKKHRYIAHSMRKPDDELVFSNKETININPYIRVNDAKAMLNFALDGLGIVKLHHYIVKDHLTNGSLQAVLSDYNNSEIPIYVAYPKRRYTPSKTRCFIDYTMKLLSKLH